MKQRKIKSITTYFLELPQFSTILELSDIMKLSEQTLYHLSYRVERFYKIVRIPKKSGGFRNLACPSEDLKAVQAWILRNILDKLRTEESATGFKSGMGIFENVQRHAENLYILCMDIEDFFPSTPRKHVYNLFRSLGYNKHISLVLTNYCTYKDGLPQGGVTSPALSNILNIRLDRRISGYTNRKNIIYTRYADDITLSSNNVEKLIKAKEVIKKIIEDEGYKVNDKKTRILRPGARRKVTGLIISDKKQFGIGKQTKRILRAKIHHLETKVTNKDEYYKLRAHIMGWMAFLKGHDHTAAKQLEEYWRKILIKANMPQVASSNLFSFTKTET